MGVGIFLRSLLNFYCPVSGSGVTRKSFGLGTGGANVGVASEYIENEKGLGGGLHLPSRLGHLVNVVSCWKSLGQNCFDGYLALREVRDFDHKNMCLCHREKWLLYGCGYLQNKMLHECFIASAKHYVMFLSLFVCLSGRLLKNL